MNPTLLRNMHYDDDRIKINTREYWGLITGSECTFRKKVAHKRGYVRGLDFN
jgi:hypothetical protein